MYTKYFFNQIAQDLILKHPKLNFIWQFFFHILISENSLSNEGILADL